MCLIYACTVSEEIKKGSIINVGATHIRVVPNILFCNKIDIYKLIPYHKSNHTIMKG